MSILDILPLNSPLRRTNSWKGFLSHMRGIIHSKSYRYQDITTLFRWIDPDFSDENKSFSQRCIGYILGYGFPYGRKALYFDFFKKFLRQYRAIFQDAPADVILTFNQLLIILFPHKDDYLSLLLDESWAIYRNMAPLDRFLEDGKRAQERLQKWVSSPQQSLFPQSTKTVGEVLETLSGELDEEESEYDALFIADSTKYQYTEAIPKKDLLEYKALIDQFLMLNRERIFENFSSYRSLRDEYIHLSPSSSLKETEEIVTVFYSKKESLKRSFLEFSTLQHQIEMAFLRKQELIERYRSLGEKELLIAIEKINPLCQSSAEEVDTIDRELMNYSLISHDICSLDMKKRVSAYIALQEVKIDLIVKNWDLFSLDFLFSDMKAIGDNICKRVEAVIGSISTEKEWQDLFVDTDLFLIRSQKKERLLRAQELHAVLEKEFMLLESSFLVIMVTDEVFKKELNEEIMTLRRDTFCLYTSFFDLERLFFLCRNAEEVNTHFCELRKRIEEYTESIHRIVGYLRNRLIQDDNRSIITTLFRKALRSINQLDWPEKEFFYKKIEEIADSKDLFLLFSELKKMDLQYILCIDGFDRNQAVIEQIKRVSSLKEGYKLLEKEVLTSFLSLGSSQFQLLHTLYLRIDGLLLPFNWNDGSGDFYICLRNSYAEGIHLLEEMCKTLITLRFFQYQPEYPFLFPQNSLLSVLERMVIDRLIDEKKEFPYLYSSLLILKSLEKIASIQEHIQKYCYQI